jgi:hypothetical protein
METIHHFFAAFDIFSVLINSFPSIFNPLLHGFQSLFMTVFTSMKHIVTLNPGLICGTIFMSLVYFIVTSFSRLRKARV